jgi:ACR3 family arsenite efflux pump ArsB
VLIWAMIFPMMVQIDFGSILNVRKQPRGITITLVTNWLIKPFTMFFLALHLFPSACRDDTGEGGGRGIAKTWP